MSDIPVPSYRIRPSQESGGGMRRMAMIAGGLLLVAGVAGGAVWGFTRYSGPSGIPVVEADPRPIRIRPSDPGGMQVPNQGELIFNRDARGREAAVQGRAALTQQAEVPDIAGLREQAAPPRPPAVALTPVVPRAAPAARPEPAHAEPAPTPAPAAPPAAQAASGNTMVQLGALNSEALARGEWERLSRAMPGEFQGRRPLIVPYEREGRSPLYRLRASGMPDGDAARALCEKVKSHGGACMVIGGG